MASLIGCNASQTPVMPGEHATPLTADTGTFSVRLVDESGHTLPTYSHRGGTFVEGFVGRRYEVIVENRGAERIEVVVTVDGRDVLSGQPGDFKAQRGYVINGYSDVRIDGFRQSMSNVAAFRFTSPKDSYSSRMGSPENVGVIGVAVFTEAHRPPPPPRRVVQRAEESLTESSFKAAPADSAASSSPDFQSGHRKATRSNIGTQYGESRHSPALDVPFERGSENPAAVLAMYYDDRQGLIERGVLPGAPPPQVHPNPFPDSPTTFAPPPPGY